VSTGAPSPAPWDELEEAGRNAEALAEAWRAYDREGGGEAKAAVVRLLSRYPEEADPARETEIAALLGDPDVDPLYVAAAGWRLALRGGAPLAAPDEDPSALARRIEAHPLTLRLLEEHYVSHLEAEIPLTRLRRWLLLSGRWAEHPRLVAALAAQARHHGGAWLFEADEEARLDALAGTPVAAAYRPEPTPDPPGPAPEFADSVTRAVAEQYRHWPYPVWTRAMALQPQTLPEAVEKRDAGRPSGLPAAADLLIAGCGTGREAALRAMTFPDAAVWAIDISPTSLAYAAERCRALGLDRIHFRLLDLHRAPELGRRFHFIECAGVLHHLPDPEAGWATLAEALRPGGIMRVMVYSKIARLAVQAARALVADIAAGPIDEARLREARRRLIASAPHLLASSRDFYTLGGVHDLLLHRHEDPFDIPRLGRALDRLGLELLAFELPTPLARARYRRDRPEDPLFRDLEAMAALERREPSLFRGMYSLWCRKPGG
jgi:SAM-dependent methyltransferase